MSVLFFWFCVCVACLHDNCKNIRFEKPISGREVVGFFVREWRCGGGGRFMCCVSVFLVIRTMGKRTRGCGVRGGLQARGWRARALLVSFLNKIKKTKHLYKYFVCKCAINRLHLWSDKKRGGREASGGGIYMSECLCLYIFISNSLT